LLRSDRIFAGQDVKFGAAWKKTSRAGCEYLLVKTDDPSFLAAVFASLVTAEGGGSYALIWSRRSGDRSAYLGALPLNRRGQLCL
jgi:uncharacterized protein (DUF736 family)